MTDTTDKISLKDSALRLRATDHNDGSHTLQVDAIITPGPTVIADGGDVALGTTTDAAASDTTPEGGTARTGISLWKGIKNLLIKANTVLGATNDAAVGDNTGSANAHLRQIAKTLGAGISAAVTGTVTVSDGTKVDASGVVITGEAVEAGGSGLLGWLSSIRHGITALVAAALGTTSDAAVGNATGSINAHMREIARLLTSPAFDVTDSIVRPNNAGPYSVNQAINCDLTVTEVSYVGLVVTVKAVAHGLFGGTDTAHARVTIAGINTGATLTHVDGNWTATPIDADHFSFTVAIQPTGTNNQTGLTITHAVAKMLRLDMGGEAGSGVLLSTLKLSLPGKGMTGAVRLYLDTSQVTVLIDGTTFPLDINNQANRKYEWDLTPVTENASSTGCIANVTTNIIIKRAAGDTGLYFRLVAEAAAIPTALGAVNLTASGMLCAL